MGKRAKFYRVIRVNARLGELIQKSIFRIVFTKILLTV